MENAERDDDSSSPPPPSKETFEVPRKIVRCPKVVAYEKQTETRAHTAFEELARVVEKGDSSSQLAALDHIRGLFAEAESK